MSDFIKIRDAELPEDKLGIIAVSRDCFPIALSTQRRENIVRHHLSLYEEDFEAWRKL